MNSFLPQIASTCALPFAQYDGRFSRASCVQNVIVDGVRINYVQHDQHHIRKDSENGVPLSYLGSYYLIFCQPAA